MPTLNVSLTGGVLLVTPDSTTSRTSTGCSFPLQILDIHKSAQDEISQARATVDSPAAWQALPWPTGMQGRTLYLRRVETSLSEPYSVRLTKAVTGQETLENQRGMVFLEFDETDYLTAVEIQGSLTLEYSATGRR